MRVNQSFCSIFGYTAAELSIIPFSAYTYPDDLEAVNRLFEALNGGLIHSYVLEKQYIHKMRQIIWVQLYVSSVRDKTDSINYCISRVLDITRHKKAGIERIQSGKRSH